MTNLQEEHTALQEEHSALKSAHAKAQEHIADLEQQVATQQDRLSQVVQLEAKLKTAHGDIDALKQHVSHWKHKAECYESEHDKSREDMRGFDAGTS